MKILTKKTTLTVLTTLLLATTGTALAGNPLDSHSRKGPHNQRGDHMMPVVGSMMRAVRHLDLSDEQEESIRAIMKDLKKQMRPLTAEAKDGHEQLKDLIKADVYDESAVAALAENEGALATERLIVTSRAMSEVYGQLTDEQRAELETMASERAARRAERRNRRSEKETEPSS